MKLWYTVSAAVATGRSACLSHQPRWRVRKRKNRNMSTRKSATKKTPAKATAKVKDLKPTKNVKGGPAFMKLGDIKGEYRAP